MFLKKYKFIILAAVIIIAAILIYIFRVNINYYLFGGTQIGLKFTGSSASLPDQLKYENNILNIRYNAANDWKGLTGNKNGFCTFNNVENCIRAGSKILDSYYTRNVKTVEQIISTYAPSIENNTQKYIIDVCFMTGFKPSTIIDSFDDRATLLQAMSTIEVGGANVPNLSVFKFAVRLK